LDASDLARIRFVTSRYRQLQGLRQLAIVPPCLLLLWFQPYVRLLRYLGPWEAMAGLILSVVPMLMIAGAHPLLDRYYTRKFGAVAPDAVARRDSVLQGVLLSAGILIDGFVLAGQRGPSATVLALGILSLHIGVRDWPWRAHHLIVTMVCAWSTWVTIGAPASPHELPAWLRNALTTVLCVWAVAACLDHRLLARAMPPHPESRADDLAPDHADSL
jgi:hypothetical protein